MIVVYAIVIHLLQVSIMIIDNQIEHRELFTGSIDNEKEHAHLENELYHIEKKMKLIREVWPTIEEYAKQCRESLERGDEERRNHHRRKHHHRKEKSPVRQAVYSDIDTLEMYDY